MSNRLSEIQSNLEIIQTRIKNACIAAGRDISEITLIAVTKTYPASDVDLLKQLGIETHSEIQTLDVGKSEFKYVYFKDPDDQYVSLVESTY